jgi:hypothetical protein
MSGSPSFSSPQFQTTELVWLLLQIPERFTRYVRPLARIYPVNHLLPVTMSTGRTCPTCSLGSRDILWTYLISEPDMSSPADFPVLSLMHQSCPVSRPGSSNVFQICSDSFLDMSRSLTPQRADSLLGL